MVIKMPLGIDYNHEIDDKRRNAYVCTYFCPFCQLVATPFLSIQDLYRVLILYMVKISCTKCYLLDGSVHIDL